MLEICQVTDLNKYINIINTINDNEIKVMEAYDKENVLGYALFSYSEDIINIYELKYNGDLNLCDGIVRAILFKASLIGIDKAEYHFEELESIQKLGLIDKNSNYLSSIKIVMDGCRNCKYSC